MKSPSVLPLFCAIAAAALFAPPAMALQQLCSMSPENPTVVLGMLGAAAAGYPWLRDRASGLFKRKRGASSLEQRP